MYQLLSSGQHPLYRKDSETYYEYLSKLRALTTSPFAWTFPAHFSE
jgi:hypothetical protein